MSRVASAAWRHRTSAGTFVGPVPERPGFLASLVGMARDLVRQRHALGVFVGSQFRATYRAQALGVFWPIANPLLLTAVMSVVFGAIFPTGIQGFPVYLLLGLIIWNFLVHAWTNGTRAFVQHASLVKNTEIPPLLVVVGNVLSSGIALGLASLSLMPLFAIYPASFHFGPALLVLPVLLVLLFVFAVGLCLATAVMHVLYRDVAYVVDSILLVLFWLTPIVYPIERVPETIRRVLLLSPLTGILSCLRDVVIGGRLPTGSVFLAAVGTSFACFLAGVAVYRRHAPFLADYV